MKKIVFVTLTFASFKIFAKESTSCFDIKGMTCAACSVTIKAAAKKLNGINSIQVLPDKKIAIVKFNDELTTTANIANSISNTGYNATESLCK